MFDSVGRRPRSSRRRGVALLISVAMNGAGLASMFLIGGRDSEPVTEVVSTIERFVEVALPAPGSPAQGPSGRSSRPPRPPAPMLEPTAVVSAVDVPGVGTGTGEPGSGGPEGPPGGGGGGEIGPGGGGMRVVHWSEVRVKVRPQVRPRDYPEAASALGLPDARCVVRIRIDESGMPSAVEVRDCLEIYREAAANVALRYRFEPLTIDGIPVPAQFDLALNFKGR